MDTFIELIGRWPSLQAFADDAGVRYGTAQIMKFRDSIHPKYWPRIVEAAHARGMRDVTAAVLAELAAKRAVKPERPSKRAAYQPAA